MGSGRDVEAPLWVTEADVAAQLDMPAAIAAVERGLAMEARGAAQSMLKTHVRWGGGDTLHAIGAACVDAGVVGTKTWAHTAGGATPLLLVFDAVDGALRAIIEAFALGQLRTGAMSGVATRWLAVPDACELAVIGAGKQAMAQVAAVAAVRALRAVRIFSPTAAHRELLANRVGTVFGVDASAADSVRAAAAGASVVTLVTRAREPILTADMLAGGAHVNAVGAITHDRVELATDVFTRCGIIVADSVPTAQRLSRELQEYVGARGDWSTVRPLCEVVAGATRREPATDVTLFKAMGLGIADLSLGIEVLARARRTGRGRAIPHPQPVELDWRPR